MKISEFKWKDQAKPFSKVDMNTLFWIEIWIQYVFKFVARGFKRFGKFIKWYLIN